MEISNGVKKICLTAIYIGIGIILISPILVDNRFLFPFITTKVFLFRITVELLVLPFLLLNFLSEEYRPRWNWLWVFLTGFIGVAAISSYLGGNWSLSFWGDVERSEGLNLWLHLLAFFVILTSAVKTRAAWMGFLDFSLGASLLLGFFGLGQALKLESILATSGGRIDATLGNPSFFATYLILHIAIAMFLLILRPSRYLRFYYLAVILFYVGLIFATQTRGAVLGVLAGVLASALLLVISARENRKLRSFSAALILLVLLAAGSIWVFRESPLVQKSFLRRVATISLQNRTAQTRLASWGAAWSGWKEKFFLGWGLENFDVVFNKNFPPMIYEDQGSQVWFDRAHNVVFDRGVSTGIAGLLLFLTFLLYPVYYLLRHHLSGSDPNPDPTARNIAIITFGLTIAYLVQDLFIFETVVVYVVLFFIWAFLSSQYLPRKGFSAQAKSDWALVPVRRVALALTIIYAMALVPLLWKTNIVPARVNAQAVKALRSDPEKEDFFMIVEHIKKVLAENTYGRQEYRLQYIEFVDQQFANVGELVPQAKTVLEYFDEQARLGIEESPDNAKYWLLAMRHYNYTFAADPAARTARLNKALEYYPQLAALSPTRPHVHQEAGYTHLYLYREYKTAGDKEAAERELKLAEELFYKTVDLNSQVAESYINLMMLYLNSGDDQKIRELIVLMDERNVNFRTLAHLSKLSSLARSNDRLEWAGHFNEELTKAQPDYVQGWINLAIFYATKGDRARAIEIAQRVKQFGGQYVQQAELFIQSVNRGEYESNR